nr:immunoglobulin heavy chain junction region [Macaca mulatta]
CASGGNTYEWYFEIW